jgi:hypothetical protein
MRKKERKYPPLYRGGISFPFRSGGFRAFLENFLRRGVYLCKLCMYGLRVG